MREMLEKLGQPKEKIDAQVKQGESQAATGGGETLIRQEIESERARRKADYDSLLKRWETDTPADPNLVIARVLRRFLDTTADVDFGAKGKRTLAEAGQYVDFENDAYEKKPWQWQFAWEVGPEVTGTARTAAAEWVEGDGPVSGDEVSDDRGTSCNSAAGSTMATSSRAGANQAAAGVYEVPGECAATAARPRVREGGGDCQSPLTVVPWGGR
jgi:hypothetical protein